jgi:DNA polymerase-3 subunit delta
MENKSQIHFLYGNDEYAIARRVQKLAAIFTDASEAEMNTARLDARTMTQEQWVNAVHALPFLAKQRLVVLAHPSARFSRRRTRGAASAEPGADADSGASQQEEAKSAAEAREKFLASLESLPETTALVITETMEFRTRSDRDAAEKHWLAAWLRKRHHSVELLVQPQLNMMAGWIMKEARAQGGEVANQGAARLADMVGTDTRQAAQEITKLLTYVNWKRPVTAADVEALSPLTAAPDVFAMVDALANRKGKEAQRLLHRLLEFQDEFSMWGMIIRQFRLVLLAREVLDNGGGEAQAAQAMGVQPFVAGKALTQARNFTMARLEQIYHRLLEIDEGAKTGRMPLDVALDLLVAELAA